VLGSAVEEMNIFGSIASHEEGKAKEEESNFEKCVSKVMSYRSHTTNSFINSLLLLFRGALRILILLEKRRKITTKRADSEIC
jgi:hypothetical protein